MPVNAFLLPPQSSQGRKSDYIPRKIFGTVVEPNWDKNVKNTTPSLKLVVYKMFKRKRDEENRMMRMAYSEYLNKFVKTKDMRYLPNEKVRHHLIPLNTEVGEVVLSPSKFKQGLNDRQITYSRIRDYDTKGNDPLSEALEKRRVQNATKMISTIVFISTRDSKGFAISGYIDLEQSIRRFKDGDISSHPWPDIFAGHRRLQPNSHDLSFIAWKKGRVFYNDSDNYRVIADPLKGLCFSYKGDGTLIHIEKKITDDHPSCIFIDSPKHGCAVIYDHRIRRKL